jgi:hypothetical protein
MVAALIAMVFSLACAPRQAFVPAERLTAFSPQGHVAAEYDLRTRRGVVGHVRVWSHGAERVRFDGGRRALVHVGLVIQNDSNMPLAIDEERTRLDWATVNGTVYENIPVAHLEGEKFIPPGGETRVDVYFAMIPGVYPTDVRGFRLRWAVRDDQAIHAQRTPFIRDPRARAPTHFYYPGPYYYHRGFWGPRWGPWWGPGPRRW